MPFAGLTDVRCYYELLGAGDPVLLIPGLGATCTLWDGVAGDLAESFSLILLDNRGVGRSIPVSGPHTLADLAVDLVELMDHLQLDRAHVIGLSFGGIIAQQLAVDHPSRVDRLVLVSCTNRFGAYLTEVARLLAQALRYFPPALYRRTVELLTTAPEYLDAHADDIERRVATACGSDVPRAAVARQLRCLGSSDLTERREYRIAAPTLVVAGEHDTLIPACYARQMAREIPGSEFLLVPGCGHNPFYEKPELVVPRIRQFLTRPHAAGDSPKYAEAQLAMEEAL
jgi:pimeloyl-ACP methyl ester carboxylesterase